VDRTQKEDTLPAEGKVFFNAETHEGVKPHYAFLCVFRSWEIKRIMWFDPFMRFEGDVNGL
jgi:hypothetical protein